MISLLDARSDSLTVTWQEVVGAERYILELKTGDDDDFKELSSKLTQTQAKKKNLATDKSYSFRVAPVLDENGNTGSWITHDNAFRTISIAEETKSMDAPTTSIGGNQTLTVKWTNVAGATGYELQMRENKGGGPWTTIAASLSGTEVKKKNLTSTSGYQFRIRPSDGNDTFPFSPPSETAIAKGLAMA